MRAVLFFHGSFGGRGGFFLTRFDVGSMGSLKKKKHHRGVQNQKYGITIVVPI
jgi:hypothetical protein